MKEKKKKKNKKPKNYKTRAKVYKGLGKTSIISSTMGGFVVYESIMDWSNFKKDIDEFVVVNEASVKLNLAIAFPILIAIVVLLFVFARKNREFLKDKVSISLLISIVIFYLVYSVIEVTLVCLIGAFVGSVIDEGILSPLSNSASIKYKEEHDEDLEYNKELKRIKARKKARAEELNGSV